LVERFFAGAAALRRLFLIAFFFAICSSLWLSNGRC
jgi:hypothetical protein